MAAHQSPMDGFGPNEWLVYEMYERCTSKILIARTGAGVPVDVPPEGCCRPPAVTSPEQVNLGLAIDLAKNRSGSKTIRESGNNRGPPENVHLADREIGSGGRI